MGNDELLNYISLFREKAEQGKLVIFVGAGVSCNVDGMPSWNKLIQNMAKAINYSRCNSCRHKAENCESACLVKDDFSIDEFLKIPQHVFNKDKELYNRVLAESIPIVTADAPLSSAIFDVNPAHIITTNYDKLLESSKNIFCEQYQVIVHDKDLLNADKGKYIIKMHGDISEASSIVLKEQDYLDYSQTHVLIELFIKSLLTDHIVLFLGYSLNDYNIKLILSWLNYMRSQNGALDNNKRVGYIILDQQIVDDTQLSYFNNNNIEVINLRFMPLVENIPADLSNEIGKRLYSFLRVIADPALEKNLSSIRNTVKFMSRFSFVSYEQILKLLYVKRYEVTNWQLRLSYEHDYTRLITFMESEDEYADKLKQLFLNAGILFIECYFKREPMRFCIGELPDNTLLKSEIFNLYIYNKYDEIQSLLSNRCTDFEINETLFYKSIVDGYGEILKLCEEVDYSEFSTDQKVAYLNNSASLNAFNTCWGYWSGLDSTKVRQFIQNLASSKEREIFSGYLDIYNGNAQKRYSMCESLENLKKDVADRNTIHFGSTSIGKLYEIKPLAITHYFFYYNNHILYQGFRDLKDFFRPYIEAIICANIDAAEKTTLLGDIKFANKKYSVEYIDLDIMTKFISTKDLSAMINANHVKRLNIDMPEVSFLEESFKNLCHSIVTARTYGFMQSSFSTLSNIVLLLNLVGLDCDGKKTIAASIEELLSDEIFVQKFFSIGWPDFKQSLREFSKLCCSLTFSPNFELIHQIVGGEKFFEYTVNVNFNSLRHLIEQFISKDEETTDKIQTLIDATENFNSKVILLRLFYRQITGDATQQKYKRILSDSFAQLPIDAIYDFAFSGWLTPNQDSIKEFLNGILEISKKGNSSMRVFPNPVETKLECVYLLHISDMLADISMLKPLSEGRPHLQFLLDPKNFDYSQVDFSDYMWENFARREEYMKAFVAHEEVIIPKIQKRIETGEVTEAEKRILYGFLLKGDEVWKM